MVMHTVLNLPALLAVARGETPGDLLLRNGKLVNVFSGTIEEADLVIADGRIAGIGTGYAAQQVVDLAGAYVLPGLIDAHVHIESSLCVPAQFAVAVLPRGVTTAVVDPHEIANVVGAAGVRYMQRAARHLPLNVVIMAPSCVPATHMETNGATLDSDALAHLLEEGVVHGLAEVMNYPGVVNGDPGVLSKLGAFRGHPIDGHAPGLLGMPLNAYVAAGIGSEHECTTVEEAAAKLARGLRILIREATNAHNLHTLLPLITPHNSRRIAFCTDDRMPADLLDQGSIDYMLREAVAFGIDPIDAIRMATLNSAEWFGLTQRGALAPGRFADLLVVDDLRQFTARQVYSAGELVAQDGALCVEIVDEGNLPVSSATETPGKETAVNVHWPSVKFQIPVRGARVRVIGAQQDQLITEARILEPRVVDGQAVADPARDLLKIAVIERHRASGAVGLGFVQGFGLHTGALAGTVAHDHHNLIVVGADDGAMEAAARRVGEIGGGLVVVRGEKILAELPLPVAGLMSDRPIAAVRAAYDALLEAAHDLGSTLHDPFMAMSFMALEVIPKLKLTDQGLVDVELFDFVDLFVD
ncbi:MAG: adenine deaminase [Litorilinea sp.]